MHGAKCLTVGKTLCFYPNNNPLTSRARIFIFILLMRKQAQKRKGYPETEVQTHKCPGASLLPPLPILPSSGRLRSTDLPAQRGTCRAVMGLGDQLVGVAAEGPESQGHCRTCSRCLRGPEGGPWVQGSVFPINAYVLLHLCPLRAHMEDLGAPGLALFQN